MRSFGVVVCVAVVLGTAVAPCRADNGFNVKRDAFSISNAPGYCFAMAAFSRWYYLNLYLANPYQPSLRKVFDESVQTRIAREIQRYYSENLVTIQAKYCNKYSDNPSESFDRFITALLMGEPQIVLLMNKTERGAILHAVLAYGCSPGKRIIRVYDPNYADEEREIDLSEREYTSLDITYTEICFPDVLNDHSDLVRKMQGLYNACITHQPIPKTRRAGVGSPKSDPGYRHSVAATSAKRQR
jgi:hypothetical protein